MTVAAHPIDLLKNAHLGQDIWVIAAGASMNFVNPSFFEGKITVGVNRVCRSFDCRYVITKDSRGLNEILESITSETKLVLSKHESGNHHQELNSAPIPHYVFDHPAKPMEEPATEEIQKDSDRLVVSFSTITSAIHLAAYMGAKNILLCGHDCGSLDGETNLQGYNTKVGHMQGSQRGYLQWLSQIENHTAKVCFKIESEYGCNIHSLNPFINFNLEGHQFIPSNRGTLLRRR